jgi:hypothetical protein
LLSQITVSGERAPGVSVLPSKMCSWPIQQRKTLQNDSKIGGLVWGVLSRCACIHAATPTPATRRPQKRQALSAERSAARSACASPSPRKAAQKRRGPTPPPSSGLRASHSARRIAPREPTTHRAPTGLPPGFGFGAWCRCRCRLSGLVVVIRDY